ncbi:hypothetical protein M2347_001449 [Chryseobacterium sp. H1D6B]|uniref:hypothetical protein n=1 Tax=Chryseobacterium sp. H1D6B TaxID=2940588 RepID=UPI0015CA44C2|nr:hypothetical protein [Chryseobacterium sp. H1D6B]MDH6251722.1 hypothetical protein [Chryseobacterium sp. H1D6B]
MRRKTFIVLLIFIFVTVLYFVFFYKDKTLRFVPKNADAVVLVDVKKLTGQYISSLAAHPSLWFESMGKDKDAVSLKDAGMKIPDFFQIFHLKNTKFSDWYSVIELKDQKKFLTFLKQHKFADKGKNLFQKGQIFIKIERGNCILGTSDAAFENISQLLFRSSEKNTFDADQFMHHTLGSVSFISGQKIQNFSIELDDDEIEIKNSSKQDVLISLLDKEQQKTQFLDLELNAENIKLYTSFFNKSLADSAQINYCKASAELEQVNDTIISYSYDDDFNEIEKKSYQKIIQPNYAIALKSSSPQKTWVYFQNKKWINDRNQFTGIPFQPNVISENKNAFEIKSTRRPVQLSKSLKENYIFIRNTSLLSSSFSTLPASEKKIISNIDYIFYGNSGQDYYVKLKAKKEKLPLILRW